MEIFAENSLKVIIVHGIVINISKVHTLNDNETQNNFSYKENKAFELCIYTPTFREGKVIVNFHMITKLLTNRVIYDMTS